jgi:hypothetical protein
VSDTATCFSVIGAVCLDRDLTQVNTTTVTLDSEIHRRAGIGEHLGNVTQFRALTTWWAMEPHPCNVRRRT